MRSVYFPFEALGFRCNPFRTLSDAEWAELAVLPAAAEAVLSTPAGHFQFIGPQGAGKTSILLGLTLRLQLAGRRAVYEYLPPEHNDFETDTTSFEVFLLDEAQRLSAAARRRLLALAGKLSLILSTHQNLEPLFARQHLPLTTVRLDIAPAEHLRTVIERRLEYFALPGRPPPALTPAAVEHLRHKFGADLRSAERFLYEVFQRLAERQQCILELDRCHLL